MKTTAPERAPHGFCIKVIDPRGVIHYVGTSGDIREISEVGRGTGFENARTWKTRHDADCIAWGYSRRDWKVEVVVY